MNQNITVDIITVTKNDRSNLEKTFLSICALATVSHLKLHWIVIDGSAERNESEFMTEFPGNSKLIVEYIREREPGIYPAMNLGLSRVNGDFFVLLNAGDILLDYFSEVVSHLNTDFVHCFESEWHDNGFSKVHQKSNDRVSVSLARMPNHQAMIFPKLFSNWKYDENFRIAADQDLKLRLYSSGKLVICRGFVVSSLTNGVSSRKLSFREAVERSKESFKVFRKNKKFMSAASLWLLYTIRYLSRLKIGSHGEKTREIRG